MYLRYTETLINYPEELEEVRRLLFIGKDTLWNWTFISFYAFRIDILFYLF